MKPYIPFDGDWPHQTYAVTEAVRKINEGETRFAITSPTGGGKSKSMQRLCEHAVAEGWIAGVMSNRILLTTQLLRGLNSSGIRVGSRAAGFEGWTDIDAPVQVISSPTEVSRVLNRRDRGDEATLQHCDLLRTGNRDPRWCGRMGVRGHYLAVTPWVNRAGARAEFDSRRLTGCFTEGERT